MPFGEVELVASFCSTCYFEKQLLPLVLAKLPEKVIVDTKYTYLKTNQTTQYYLFPLHLPHTPSPPSSALFGT